MTINPKDAKPDQVYLVTYGKEPCIGVRNYPDYVTAWTLASLNDFAYSWDGVEDSKVSDLTPLVPARNITRDDLPSRHEASRTFSDALGGNYGMNAVLDAVVEHLNERGGIPAEARQSETHINVTADTDSTPADFSEKLRKLSEEFGKNVQVRALRDAEGNVVEHLLTPRTFAAGGYVPSPEGGGKLCCEKAQLLDNELARRSDDLVEWKARTSDAERRAEKAEAKVKALEEDAAEAVTNDDVIAGYKRGYAEAQEKAEAERDELQAKLDAAVIARDRWIERAHDLECELDYRTTLDRESVESAIARWLAEPSEGDDDAAPLVDAIMALALAAEGWPEWLGPRVDPDDFEVERGPHGDYYIDDDWVAHANSTVYGLRKLIAERIGVCARYKAVARLIESEQAATDDKEQRVEKLARELHSVMSGTSRNYLSYDEMAEDEREAVRAVIRAGWTPPESEDEK